MDLLVLQIVDRFWPLRLTERERAVTILPIEPGKSRRLFLEPARRPLLHVHDNVRERLGAMQVEQNMHVIGHIVHFDRAQPVARWDASCLFAAVFCVSEKCEV